MKNTTSSMVDALVCGIDVGSTNVKVLLLDGRAQTRWVKSIPVPRVAEQEGPVTDAMALVATLEGLIVEGWHATGATAPLRAIAITGVGEDGVPVNGDLRPLDRAIPWFDRRAQGSAAVLNKLGCDVRAGVPIDFSRTAAKWRWLRDHRAQRLGDAKLWLALTDFPAAWWSRTPFMSETLAARTGCYDVFGRRWLATALVACGAPPLPPVVTAGTVMGCVAPGHLIDSGAASAQTLIVAGGHDHPVAASAVRRLDPEAIVDSLGTANLMYDEVGVIAPRSDPCLAFSVPALGRPGSACLGVFEFSASLERLRAQDAGVLLQTFLAGASAPGAPSPRHEIESALRSALRPGSPRLEELGTTRIRPAIEANCFYARRMRDAIVAAGSTSKRLYAVGGWARSQALLQVRASVFGTPVLTVDEQELTAVGAALIASDGVGHLPSSAFQRATRIVQPRADWQDAYERDYPGIRDTLRELQEQV